MVRWPIKYRQASSAAAERFRYARIYACNSHASIDKRQHETYATAQSRKNRNIAFVLCVCRMCMHYVSHNPWMRAQTNARGVLLHMGTAYDCVHAHYIFSINVLTVTRCECIRGKSNDEIALRRLSLSMRLKAYHKCHENYYLPLQEYGHYSSKSGCVALDTVDETIPT